MSTVFRFPSNTKVLCYVQYLLTYLINIFFNFNAKMFIVVSLVFAIYHSVCSILG